MPYAGSYSAPFSTQRFMKDPDMATLARNATGKTSIGRLRSAFAELIGYYERSEEHTSELQSLMRISYAVFCLKKKNKTDKSISRNNKMFTRKIDATDKTY